MTATLTAFTDPFCTWSWGSEPALRWIEETYDAVAVRFVTGGLVEDFETFRDGTNDIDEPADIAPHWETAAERHGMPVDSTVWLDDPPRSSYPASRAYHAATFQGIDVAHRYLRRMREAFAAEGRNIGDETVLEALAEDVGLDVERFSADVGGDRAREAFRADREEARARGATAFPSFEVEGRAGRRLLRGWTRVGDLAEALETVAPDLERSETRPLPAFVAARDRVATREVAAVYDLERETAFDRLRALETEGIVRSRERGTGRFWELAEPA